MAKAEKTDKAKTARIVLVRVDVDAQIVLADGDVMTGGRDVWSPVRDEEGELRIFYGTKRAVIDEYAGKGADAKPGEYRAPNARSWAGSKKIVLPERPTPEALWDPAK